MSSLQSTRSISRAPLSRSAISSFARELAADGIEFDLRRPRRSRRQRGRSPQSSRRSGARRIAWVAGSGSMSGDEPRRAGLLHPEQAVLRSRRRELPGSAQNQALLPGSWSRSRPEAPAHEHAARHRPIPAATRPTAAKGCCPEEASAAGCQRQLPFSDRFRREPERLRNVLRFEVRIERENLVHRRAIRDELDDHRDGDAQTANTRRPTQLIGPSRDARESHRNRLALWSALWDPDGASWGRGGLSDGCRWSRSLGRPKADFALARRILGPLGGRHTTSRDPSSKLNDERNVLSNDFQCDRHARKYWRAGALTSRSICDGSTTN